MRSILTLLLLLWGSITFSQVSSLFLPGPINYVEAGDLDVTGDQLTLEAIIQYTGASVNIVSKHTGPGNVNYLLRIGSFEITTTNGFANFGGVAAAGVNLVQGETYHLAATYNGQFLRYYVNGCLTGEMAWTGDMVQNDLLTAIGQQSNCQCEQFTGYIDEVRIWNVARTQQEIEDNMMDLPNPTTTPGLLAYYKFDNSYVNVQGNAAFNGAPIGAPQFQSVPAPLPNSLNLSTYSSDPVCNGGSDGLIEAFGSGAYVPYEYSIDGGNFAAANTFSNLGAGTYTIALRPQNNQNCVVSEQVVISEPTAIEDGLLITGPLCNGGTDGEASVTPAGGHGPDYTINWTQSGNDGTTETGLSAGNYDVDITDTCVASGSELVENGHFQSYYQGFTTDYGIGVPGPDIGGSNLAVTYDANLFHSGFVGNGNQGTGNFMVINGNTNPNQNIWCQTVTVTPNTNYNFSMWLSSLYTVSPGEVEVLFNGVPVGGPFVAPATTGVWDEHTLFWNSGTSTQVHICIVGVNLDNVGNDFGIDDISLKECMSCTENFTFTVNEPTALQLNATTVSESCGGALDGEIDMNVTGGTGAYEYSIDTAATFQAGNIFQGLSGGDYSIIVRDQNGCQDTLEVTVDVLPSITFDVNISDVSCFEGSDGTIEIINVQNGINPITFSSDNGNTFQPGNIFNGLVAGNYTVLVEDDSGCNASEQVVVDQPDDIAVEFNLQDISCFNAVDGSLIITNTTGGTGTYEYSLDATNFQAGTTFNGLDQGAYTLTIQDQNGCLKDTTFNITEPLELVTTVNTQDLTCFESGDGSILFDNTSGGTPNYLYSIDAGNSYDASSSYGNLSAGSYDVEVVDGNGCSYVDNVVIQQPDVIQPDAQVVDALCFGDCNGAIAGSAQGGTSPYTILWSGENVDQVGPQINDLCPGGYILTVVDDNGCTQEIPVTVDQPPQVNADFTTSEDSWTILDPSVNFMNLSDNATNYEWTFGDGNSSSAINPSHTYPENAQDYLVRLIAENDFGCADTVRMVVKIENEIIFFIPNTFTPDGNKFNETFKVEFFAGYEPQDYSFLVLNRWGEVVFEASSPNDAWDGNYLGKPVQDGTYVWRMEFRETVTDERYIKTGHVNVIR